MINLVIADRSSAWISADLQALQQLGGLQVLASTSSLSQLVELLAHHRPQVLLVGCQAGEAAVLSHLEWLLHKEPLPILLLAAGLSPSHVDWESRVRQAGILEVLPHPGQLPEESWKTVHACLRILAGVKVIGRRNTALPPTRKNSGVCPRVLAIGASTGGPQALGTLLKGLQENFPWPILCVQHLSQGFLPGLLDWLKLQAPLRFEIAQTGKQILAGTCYFAPDDHHLRVEHEGRLSLDRSPPVDGHRPSASVLFESVAQVYGRASIGVLLTGMGNDGARGLLEMARSGAITLAQNEDSSVVFGMPRQALELGAVKQTHSLEQIIALILAERNRVP